MIRLSPLTTLSAAIMLLLASTTYAEPHDGRFPIDLEEVATRQAQHFDVLDADNDDLVSLSEFEQAEPPRHARRKHRPRKMRDGARGRKQGQQRGDPERRGAIRAATQAEVFALLDTNSDGVLSSEEHAAGTRKTRMLANKRARFSILDGNSDGYLDQTELPSRLMRLRQADTDGDGKVTRRELRELRKQAS